jgi:hypothetical protein
MHVCLFAMLKAGIKSKGLVHMINANTQFGVFANTFFKEVCLPQQADGLHPFEWIPYFVMMGTPKGD